MKRIQHELDKMRGYLMKSTTHCLRNYWKNDTMGKDDFRRHSSWEWSQTWQNGNNLKRGHDTPVKWISKGKKMIMTKQEYGLKRATSQFHRKKREDGMEWTEEKTIPFTSNELEKASLGEGSNGVVGKPTTKRVSLLWAYGKYLEIMRWQPATHGKKFWLRARKDRKLLPPRW